jgi:predicted choloylglycine hydrolase
MNRYNGLSRRELLILGAATAGSCMLKLPARASAPSFKFSEKVLAGSDNDFMVVRHLQLEGSNREIGKKLAQIAKTRHRTKLGEADPSVNQARKAFFEKHYPIAVQRAKGAVEEYGADWSNPKLDPFGLGYDLLDSPGCSTVYYPPGRTADGHAVLSRNYDFSTRTFAEIIGMPAERSSRPFTGDPYVIEVHPDKGYPSLYICSYDLLMGGIDGMNSKGLSVALLADDKSPGAQATHTVQAGLGELEVPRFVLDNCATVDEAKAALKEASYYYSFVPCHYIIADRSGKSFVWEHTIEGNNPKIVDGGGKTQIVTNHLLSDFPAVKESEREPFPAGTFYRYCTLQAEIDKRKGKLSMDDIKAINGEVQAGPHMNGAQARPDPRPGRTLWHAIYDLHALTLDVSFYMGEQPGAPKGQRRTGYLHLSLS